MNKILNNQQIKIIFDIAIKAGEMAIEGFYQKNFQVFEKPDGSKVSSIDIKISDFISKNLQLNFPNILVICEEGNKKIENQNMFFLVDPIDGTNSFISSSDQFSINIALISNDQPIFGLIYAPIFEGGKLIFSDENNQIIIYHVDINFEQFLKPLIHQENILKIIASKGNNDKKIVDFLANNFSNYQNYQVEKYSSAIKFIIFALGRADLYLHFKKSMEWDTASGQFLLEKLGAKIVVFDFDKNFFDHQSLTKLSYRKLDFINPSFLILTNNLIN